MATQTATGARNASAASGVKGNVSTPSGKPSIGRNIEQPKIGKIGGDMSSMPGSSGKGQGVKTVKSNPPVGKNVQGNTAMGSGGVIGAYV